MPVNEKQINGLVLYQRNLYNAGGISKWYWDYKDKKIIQAIPPESESILDICYGEGILLEKIGKYFTNSRIKGIDFIPENIEICKHYGLDVSLGDTYKLDISDATVETVLLIEVIEHLENPNLAIMEIYRILKPGGVLIILFPNDIMFFISRLLMLKIKELTYNPGHVKQWTHKNLRTLLSSQLFVNIKSNSFPFLLFPISLHGLIIAKKTGNCK
jgi:ubiquinone/menaquinone biosynthesis C-methylase UbiE